MAFGLALRSILADARVRDIALGDQPAWIWDVETSRVSFGNAGAVALFGEPDLAALRAREFGEKDPVGRQIGRVADTLPGDGSARMAMLRLSSTGHPVPTACRCRLLELDGRRVVLIVAVGGRNDARPLEERLEALFGDDASAIAATVDGARIWANPQAASALEDGDSDVLRFALPSSAGEVTVEMGDEPARAPRDHLHLVSSSDAFGRPDAPRPEEDSPAGEASSEDDVPPSVEPSATDEPDDAAGPASETSESEATVAPASDHSAPEDGGEAEPAGEQEEEEAEKSEPISSAEEAGVRLHAAFDPADASILTAEAAHDVSAMAAGSDASPAAGSAEASPAATTSARPSQPVRHRRFTFALDGEGRVTELGPALREVVGQEASVEGRRWNELLRDWGVDPLGEIGRMIETRDTWSGAVIEWPREAGGRVPVRLAALPRFGEQRQFLGYRGFGEILEDEHVSDPAAATAEAPARHLDEVLGRDLDEERVPAEKTAPSEETAAASVLPEDISAGERASNVHRLHPAHEQDPLPAGLNERERNAFHAIARVLTSRLLPWVDEASSQGADAAHPASRTDSAEEDVPVAETPQAPQPDRAEAEEPGKPAEVMSKERPDDIAISPATPAPLNEVASLTAAIGTRSSEHRQRMLDLLARLPLGVGVIRDEQLVYANRSFLDIFGFTDLDDLDIAGGLAVLLEGRSPSEAGGATVRARHRDGSSVQIEARLSRVEWVDGPAMLLAVRRPEPLAELRAEIERLRAVVELATDGIVILDREWQVVEVNAAAERLLGGDRQRLIGGPFLALVPDQDRAIAEDYLEGLTAKRGRILLDDGVEIVLDLEDDPLPVLVSGALMQQDGHGGICLVLRDLRRWKAAEAEALTARRRAEQANEKKSDFLAKMSHEIRTPLNAIIGFAEVMLEERFGPIGNERYRDYLSDVRDSGEHIMSLINDLLDLSKVEAGRMELSFTGVKLNDIVEQTVAIMQPQANRQRVIIRTSLSMGVPPIVADSRSLRQVMMNLLSNGIKFTPAGGQVIVSTMITDEGDVSLRVRDTGVGMTEAETEIALEPFRQVGARSESSVKGSGLGLPLTKALVEANRARFAIRSRPGEGTLVEITFPQSRVLAE